MSEQGIPLSGNILGEPVFLDPRQMNPQLFRDAIRNVTASSFNAIERDPSLLANLTSFGLLTGSDPI